MENVTAQKIDKQEILGAIGKVHEASKKCNLDTTIFEKLDLELELLSNYFKTSKIQSFFISNIYSLNYTGQNVDINDLIKLFKCAPTKILEYSDDIIYLSKQNYLLVSDCHSSVNVALANVEYTVNKSITDAIINNETLPVLMEPKTDSIYSLLESSYDLLNENEENVKHRMRLETRFYREITSKDSYGIIKKLEAMELTNTDIVIYFYIIWKKLLGYWQVNMSECFKLIYGKESNTIRELQKLRSGKNILIQLKLIELKNESFMNDTGVELTNKSHKFLKEFDIHFNKDKTGKRKTIKPQKIKSKKLFYNSEEEKQLDTITRMLEEIKFKETRKRLSEKKLPKGINIVFYGPPGTGKTESVLQIAKATNREIIKVDISAAKSMWFGESEKITKKIFTDYKETAKQCKQMPILFLNEADALISKRSEVNSSSTDKTQNTIQNIFLEELENFKGILIATTNLVGNMDKAFERRFLFKVEINNPTAEVKAQIWKEKLSHLNPEEAMILAKTYDFSGGQIENIVRKKEIEEIIQGKAIRFEEIYSFCKAELFEKSYGKIGFGVK